MCDPRITNASSSNFLRIHGEGLVREAVRPAQASAIGMESTPRTLALAQISPSCLIAAQTYFPVSVGLRFSAAMTGIEHVEQTDQAAGAAQFPPAPPAADASADSILRQGSARRRSYLRLRRIAPCLHGTTRSALQIR